MSDAFAVVAKSGAATVFNNTDKDTDNEAAANEYRDELATARPWDEFKVVSASDYAKESAKATKAESNEEH